MSNRVSATRSRHEDFEQQKIVLARLTNDRGEWRKPNIPLTLQKATLLGLTGSLRYSATSEKKRPLAEPISIEADLLALRRSLMPIATKTTADTNVFDAATNTTAVKFPAVDRTLESEFLRFKPNSLLDPNRKSVTNLQRSVRRITIETFVPIVYCCSGTFVLVAGQEERRILRWKLSIRTRLAEPRTSKFRKTKTWR